MRRKPPHGTARLTLTINGQEYTPRALEPHPQVAQRAWTLRKADGTTYEVHWGKHGYHCDCPDFLWARENHGEYCKHVLALMVVGLLPVRRTK